MFKLVVDYPAVEDEVSVVRAQAAGPSTVREVLHGDDLLRYRAKAQEVHVDRLVATYALRQDAAGGYVLRATTFDIETVARVATAADTLVALDAAASLDPRERAEGHRILTARLDGFRG